MSLAMKVQPGASLYWLVRSIKWHFGALHKIVRFKSLICDVKKLSKSAGIRVKHSNEVQSIKD